MSRRSVLRGTLGLTSIALASCTTEPTPANGLTHPPQSFPKPSPLTPAAGQRVIEKTLTATPMTLDLGGRTVNTWGYEVVAPGPLVRARAGDLLRVTLQNRLPAETTIHWHGIRLRNAADGVPGLTQNPVKQGDTFSYEFTAPDPGTYFFHPHVGVQLDRALYAPLIIDDLHEPGDYDAEWIVVLDDWLDGTGTTPDEVLKKLIADGGTPTSDELGGMGGMGHGGMGGGMGGGMSMGPSPWGDANDVSYPLFLINGKPSNDPEVFTAKPRQRVRLRVINAASDTIFLLALGGHQVTVIATDGWPVVPQDTGAFYLGMGERYDAIVTLKDGVFPLVARPFGKMTGGQGFAVVRTGAGSTPAAAVAPSELNGRILIGSQLQPAREALLHTRQPDSQVDLILQGSMRPYLWGINGAPYGKNEPLTVGEGQRLRINATNMTMMTHPLHLHGHTFALPSGLRKDTVLLAPMQSEAIDLQADNPGRWMVHCHNAYHAEAGMMIALNYS